MTELLDSKIPAGWPYVALLELFAEEASPVSTAAHRIIPALVGAAERYGRRWLRANAKHLTAYGPRATRLAATTDDGIELVLHFPVAKVVNLGLTDTHTCAVVFQVHAFERWNISTAHLQTVVQNLARRRARVPVRPSKATLIRDEAAA